jgi:uncharacterized RDD family membrane protein YckC
MVSYKSLNLPEEKKFLGPASIFKRLFAFIIDIMLINILIASPFMKILRKILPSENVVDYSWLMSNKEVAGTLYTVMFFISMLALLYFTLMDYKLGQTVGKMIMNIYVVKLPELNPKTGKIKSLKKIKQDDAKVNLINAAIRNLLVIPFFPFVLLWILDPIYMIFNKNAQRFSEKISNTMTVEVMSLGFQN